MALPGPVVHLCSCRSRATLPRKDARRDAGLPPRLVLLKRAGYAMVVAAACMWGCWPLILKWAESYGHIDAALESAVVMAVLTVTTFFLFLRDRMHAKKSWRGWLGVAWLGVGDAGNVIF